LGEKDPTIAEEFQLSSNSAEGSVDLGGFGHGDGSDSKVFEGKFEEEVYRDRDWDELKSCRGWRGSTMSLSRDVQERYNAKTWLSNRAFLSWDPIGISEPYRGLELGIQNGMKC